MKRNKILSLLLWFVILLSASTTARADDVTFGYADGNVSIATMDSRTSDAENNPSTITFTQGNTGNNIDVKAVTVTYTTPTAITFAKSAVTGNLIDLGTSVQASNEFGTSATYTSSNTDIATVDANGIHFKQQGTVTITASYGSVSGSYTLNIVADDATATISDNTITFADEGQLDEAGYQVPGMKVTIGNGTNSVIVRKDYDVTGTRAIDDNGYTHLWYDDSGNVPHQGTFYTFDATASGTLTLTGSVTASGTLIWRDATSSTSEEITVTAGAGTTMTKDVTLGHKYYLYEKIESSRTFSIFMLHSMTMASTFKLSKTSHVADKGATTVTIADLVSGQPTACTVTAKCKGGVSAATVTLTGGESTGTWTLNVSNITYSDASNPGGAVVAEVSGSNGSGIFVLTIPYKTKKWDFNSELLTTMESNTTDLFLTYQVRHYTNVTDENNNTVRQLDYLNVPVVSNATAIDGTNAYYIDETAGLLVKASAKAWGAIASLPATATEGKTLTQQLAIPYTEATGASRTTIYNGTSFTIPSLTKGQYVAIKWERHADLSGDLITATNVTDLDGTAITGTFNVGSIDNNHGYEEFIVAADGDVTFTLSQSGWTNIQTIEVADKFINTDMRLYNPNITTLNTYKTNSTEHIYEGAWGRNWTTSAMTTEFYIHKTSDNTLHQAETITDGNLTATITSTGTVTVTGSGQFYIVQKARNNNYVLDTEETLITVNNTSDVTQTYPYTWDFTNISADTKTNLAADAASSSPLWSTNDMGENTYGLVVSGNNFSQSGPLSANGTTIEEFDGLGFETRYKSTAADYDRVIRINTAGGGLVFAHRTSSGAGSSVLIIPDVPTGYYVYIRARQTANTYSAFSAAGGGTMETIHTGTAAAKTADGDWIYRIPGNGADITITIQEYTVYKIGVTATFKNFFAEDTYSDATEYRDHNEKYDLTEYFTYGASPVTAQYVSMVDDGRTLAKTTDIAVAPPQTGVILKIAKTDEASIKNVPLFVKDVNTDADNVEHNMLAGVLTPTLVTRTSANAEGKTCDNYLLTTLYYKSDGSGNYSEDATQQTGTLAFRIIAENAKNNLGANKAYLQVPQSTSLAKPFYLISSFLDGTTTGISRVTADDNANIEEGTYYTLSGIRLKGKPTRRGIYIVNGKKIMVK